MTLLTLLAAYGEAAVAPGFAAEFGEMFVAQNDVGYHLRANDVSWNMAGADLLQRNLLASDVGKKIKTASVRLNIREG